MGLDMRGCTPVRLSVVMVVVAILATWTAWSAARDGAEGLTGPVSAAVSPPLDAAAPEPAPRAVDDLRALRRGPVEPAAAYAGEVAAIPAAAFAAYQRAASVIDATVDCGLDWTVVAAIGRVESDHGRGADGTHRVTRRGRVEPALVGASLDGTGGRGRLADSDGGTLDGDVTWDAPVGPMGILPATWSAVAVDADDDGVRSPQDIDDAALATAVLLCAGGTDLRSPAALRTTLASYDRARGFATTVLAIAGRYARSASAPAVVALAAPALAALPSRRTTRARPEAPVLESAAAGHHTAVRKQPVRATVRASGGRPSGPGAVPPQRPDGDPATPEDPTACPVSGATGPAQPRDDPTQDPTQAPTQGQAPDPVQQPADDPATDPACAPVDPAEDPASQEPATDPTPPTGQPSGGPSTEPVPDSAP